MGMFAETVIVDYGYSFADKRKQTSVFILQQKTDRLSFPFSVCSKK
jgi:hypothetical protein